MYFKATVAVVLLFAFCVHTSSAYSAGARGGSSPGGAGGSIGAPSSGSTQSPGTPRLPHSAPNIRVPEGSTLNSVDQISNPTGVSGQGVNAVPRSQRPNSTTLNRAEWQRRQAQHAWGESSEPGQQQQWERLGFKSPQELQRHLAFIRTNYDIKRNLRSGRTAYGKFDKPDTKNGTVVIDNPNSENGGTAFRANNVERRMRGLD